MAERVTSPTVNLFKSSLSAALLRAAGVPDSLSGASRTTSILLKCLDQARHSWPEAPFNSWIRQVRALNVELQQSIDQGSTDPVVLFRAAEPSAGILFEIQRWNLSVATARERVLQALIGRALIINLQANGVMPAELVAGFHTLRLAGNSKGKRSQDWQRLLDIDLTSTAQVQVVLDSTAPTARTYSFLTVLLEVLSQGVREPNTAPVPVESAARLGDEAEQHLTNDGARSSSRSNVRATFLAADSELEINEAGTESETLDRPRSTTTRISARLAAADYTSAHEKLGLHDRDHLLLGDLIKIAQKLPPLVRSEDRVEAGFAALAVLSLITCTSDQFVLNIPLEPQRDSIWLELAAGAWAWDYSSYRRSGFSSPPEAEVEVEPVLVPMPRFIHEALREASLQMPGAETVGDLIRAIQATDDFDLDGFRTFLRSLGDSTHPPYRARFARSFQTCLLKVTGSDMLAGLLTASFSITAPAALFYFGPTYKTIYTQLTAVYEVLGFGPCTRPFDEGQRAGCKHVPSPEACRAGWQSLVTHCNQHRDRCLATDDPAERLRSGNEWLAHLGAAFVLQSAHRGTRLEQLTAQALLTDVDMGVIHDKDDTTQKDRTHARLIQWTPAIQQVLAAAIECHSFLRHSCSTAINEFNEDMPIFCRFSQLPRKGPESISTQTIAAILSTHFDCAPHNVGRAVWVTALDELGCDRWLTRALTGHTRDITRVGDAFFDVSVLETARRLKTPMCQVTREWFSTAEVKSTPRPFSVAPTRILSHRDDLTSTRPGVPDPRTILRPVSSSVLAGWKLAQNMRSELLKGELNASPEVLSVLHLMFVDLVPDPAVVLSALDASDTSVWLSKDPCPALLWSRPHFVHPVWLPVRSTTWLLLEQVQARPRTAVSLVADVEKAIASSGLGRWFSNSSDLWLELCNCARFFRRLEMQPTLLAASDPLVPAPALNPHSITRLAWPSTGALRTTPLRARDKRAAGNRKSRGADLLEMTGILNKMSDPDLRLGERRRRAILSMEGIQALNVNWTPAGVWLCEWLMEELRRTRDRDLGCYQISSLSTYYSTLLVHTAWTGWDDPFEWEEDTWIEFIDLISTACQSGEKDSEEELHPRAKHALSALVRSLMRRKHWIPTAVLQRLSEPTDMAHPFDSASSVLLSRKDLNAATERLNSWLEDEPATLQLAQTRAMICSWIPARAGEISSLSFDCLTEAGGLVIRRVGFNVHKTQTSLRVIPLPIEAVLQVEHARQTAKQFVPSADLLLRGTGHSEDVLRDNRAKDHWHESLKSVTGDPRARPHSVRASTLQEMTWPGWQEISAKLVRGQLSRSEACNWRTMLQADWHRLAAATSAAGQSGISSAIGHYLAGWALVHAVQALALLQEEHIRPALLEQLQIKPSAYRQAKSRSERDRRNKKSGDAFCGWSWLEGRIERSIGLSPSTANSKDGAPVAEQTAYKDTAAPPNPITVSYLDQTRYLCARGLGLSTQVAHLKIGITWFEATALDTLLPTPDELRVSAMRARNGPGKRGQNGDIDLCFSPLGTEILMWLTQLSHSSLEFLVAAMFREMPLDLCIFDDPERWRKVIEKMPRSLQLQIRKGKSHIDAQELHNAHRSDLRYLLIPDAKLGRRPAVRITLAGQENRVLSARITSVVRLALLSIQHLTARKTARP